jgi:hypothetical protein
MIIIWLHFARLRNISDIISKLIQFGFFQIQNYSLNIEKYNSFGKAIFLQGKIMSSTIYPLKIAKIP